jgi:spore maturation protein CgeB
MSSSWGNGHATSYRALLRGLASRGHRQLFLERDVPWYASARDLLRPDFCELEFYRSVADLRARFGERISQADAVIVGSYVPDGIAVIDLVTSIADGVRAFYDIDTPVTVAALERDACDYLAARQVPDLDLYLSFTGGPMLRYLSRRFGARQPCALYCAVDEIRYRPQRIRAVWDLGYLGTYAKDRQPALERLLIEPARRLPDRRFVVAGPQYPAGIDWPNNVDRIEHLPPSEHVAFYCRQRFTLNITRTNMIRTGWSPSVRLFEAAACATPIISDRWAGLDELLPGGAVLIADGTDDVVSALSGMGEKARRQIGRLAREIVLTGHTGAGRARELELQIRASLAANVIKAPHWPEGFKPAEIRPTGGAASP